MKKLDTHEKYEQVTFDLGENFDAVKVFEKETESEKNCEREFKTGDKVAVAPTTKRFCDGRGIPDYAREAYIKRLNFTSKTVLLESEPNGKELGLLFISDVTLIKGR